MIDQLLDMRSRLERQLDAIKVLLETMAEGPAARPQNDTLNEQHTNHTTKAAARKAGEKKSGTRGSSPLPKGEKAERGRRNAEGGTRKAERGRRNAEGGRGRRAREAGAGGGRGRWWRR